MYEYEDNHVTVLDLPQEVSTALAPGAEDIRWSGKYFPSFFIELKSQKSPALGDEKLVSEEGNGDARIQPVMSNILVPI